MMTSDAGCGAIRLLFEATDLLLEYEGHDEGGEPIVGRLRFVSVIAFRYRDEMHSLGFAEGSYDSVLTFDDSAWLNELSGIEPRGISDVVGRKHFAVLLSQNGYLEVVAERVAVGSATAGHLR